MENQRVSSESPTADSRLEGTAKGASKAPSRPQHRRKPAKGTPVLYAVYDGHDRLGSVRGEKALGFAAHGTSGSKLGHFGTIKAAANHLASVAGGVQ